jgi:hypothetical protein
MVQRFEDWCRDWKGPPYPNLPECVREQHESALNLFRETIRGSLAPPERLLSHSGLEWIAAVVAWPGKLVILAVAASSPDAVYRFGIERTTFEGWGPLALSSALYASVALIAVTVRAMRRL